MGWVEVSGMQGPMRRLSCYHVGLVLHRSHFVGGGFWILPVLREICTRVGSRAEAICGGKGWDLRLGTTE